MYFTLSNHYTSSVQKIPPLCPILVYHYTSVIDDPTLKSGFYGAPTVCAIFGPLNFLYSIPDAFCCAENMVLAAYERGIASCIVARGEETFDSPEGMALLRKWGVPEHYVCRCFVLLGYVDGEYPSPKPRKSGRIIIVEE